MGMLVVVVFCRGADFEIQLLVVDGLDFGDGDVGGGCGGHGAQVSGGAVGGGVGHRVAH